MGVHILLLTSYNYSAIILLSFITHTVTRSVEGEPEHTHQLARFVR